MKILFLIILILMSGFILWIGRKKNAWDVMFYNTTLAIVALCIIGLLDGGLWKEIVYVLGIVAIGGGIAGIFRERRR